MIRLPHRNWALSGSPPFNARPARVSYRTRHIYPAWYIANSAGINCLTLLDQPGAVFVDKTEAFHIEQEAANWGSQ